MDSSTLQQFQREYVESRIRSAHPVEIVAMLFQVALESIHDAIGHLKSGDRFARSRSVTRAEQALQELLFSLDQTVDVPLTHNSAALYRYALGRLVAGHAQESEQPFQEALLSLEPLAAGWAQLKAQILAEPSGTVAEVEKPAEEPKISDPYAAYRETPVAMSRDWSC